MQTTVNNISTLKEHGLKEKNYIMKIVVLGDVNVGKSNIIRRILGQEFQELEATIGVEFGCVVVKNIDPEDPDITINIQIWDTSGAERYRAITTSHIRNADGAYLVYDVTSDNSFNTLDFWYECIRKATDDDIVIYLIGNKLDLVRGANYNRKVSTQRALEIARKYNMNGFCECSAKDNLNIVETSERFFKEIYNRQKGKLKEKSDEKLKILRSKKSDPKIKCC